MIVSAHQPNFAPWLGFLDKLVASDVMVLLDTVQFAKRSYQNRTRVKGPGGPQWLTVPVVTKGRYDQRTLDVEIDGTRDWRSTHPRTLHSLYARAPHRAEVLELVEPLYADEKLASLSDFTVALLRAVVDRLGITTRLVAASELEAPGAGSRLMLSCTLAAGGTVYLSGPTGREYLEPGMFDEAGVELRYHSFRPFEYPQLHGAFVPGLSWLDYVANVGFRPWWDYVNRA